MWNCRYVARIDIGTSRLAFLQYGMELAYNIIMVSLKSFDLQAVQQSSFRVMLGWVST